MFVEKRRNRNYEKGNGDWSKQDSLLKSKDDGSWKWISEKARIDHKK